MLHDAEKSKGGRVTKKKVSLTFPFLLKYFKRLLCFSCRFSSLDVFTAYVNDISTREITDTHVNRFFFKDQILQA